jgi:hypothetical protein
MACRVERQWRSYMVTFSSQEFRGGAFMAFSFDTTNITLLLVFEDGG